MTDYTETERCFAKAVGEDFYEADIQTKLLMAADALEQAQARIAELGHKLEFKDALLAGDGALIAGLKEENTALALQVEQMREALDGILEWLDPRNRQHGCECEPETGYVCAGCRWPIGEEVKEGYAALALSTQPAEELIRQHDAKVIERCAARLDEYAENTSQYDSGSLKARTHACAKRIRALIAAQKESSNV